MTVDDHSAVKALAKGMGQRNGFPATQSSDMYVSDGDGDDWTYHSQGVFRLTLEMSAGSKRRYYPSLTELNADLVRNKGAVLWYLEQAHCPYAAAGFGGDLLRDVDRQRHTVDQPCRREPLRRGWPAPVGRPTEARQASLHRRR